jgi:hypothetical protein
MDKQKLQHAHHVAKLRRDLAELRSRMGRIEHETYCGKREIDEIEAALTDLAGDGGAS